MGMNEKILHWLLNGRVGCSSKVMAACFAGIECDEKSHPHDPDDLNRCLMFLDYVPEAKSQTHKLKELSPQWSRLVERWEDIESSFCREFGGSERVEIEPTTYELMQSVIRDES